MVGGVPAGGGGGGRVRDGQGLGWVDGHALLPLNSPHCTGMTSHK